MTKDKKENIEETQEVELDQTERDSREAQITHFLEIYINQMKEVIKAANGHEIDGSEQELLKMGFVAGFECSVGLREAGLKKAGK